MPRRAAWVLLLIRPLLAHSVSMSSGELRVEGSEAVYELRIPAYELSHIAEPEKALLDAVQFRGARRLSGGCSRGVDYVCSSRYAFSGPVNALDVRSKLHEITVANHLHVLHASNGSKSDTAVLNMAYPTAELRFRPPDASELATRAFATGALKTITGWTQLLFLAGLVLAARSRRELYEMAGAFLAVEIATALTIPLTSWAPSPRFVEAACALSAGYLAIEILLLPASGHRALIVAVLSLFHGMYFASSSGLALAGTGLVEVACILLLFALTRRSGGRALRLASYALLVTSMAWFAKGLGG